MQVFLHGLGYNHVVTFPLWVLGIGDRDKLPHRQILLHLNSKHIQAEPSRQPLRLRLTDDIRTFNLQQLDVSLFLQLQRLPIINHTNTACRSADGLNTPGTLAPYTLCKTSKSQAAVGDGHQWKSLIYEFNWRNK